MISCHTTIALVLSCLSASLPYAVHKVSAPTPSDAPTVIELPHVDRLEIVIPPPSRPAREVSPNVLGNPCPASFETDAWQLRKPTRPNRTAHQIHAPAPAARPAG